MRMNVAALMVLVGLAAVPQAGVAGPATAAPLSPRAASIPAAADLGGTAGIESVQYLSRYSTRPYQYYRSNYAYRGNGRARVNRARQR